MSILFLILVSGYGFGALTALLVTRGAAGRMLTAAGAVVGAGAGLMLGIGLISSGSVFSVSVPGLLPVAGGLQLRLDGLGAFFLILIGLGAIPAAIYGAGYSKAYEDGRASLGQLGVMFNFFLLSLSLVTMADNVLTFLLMWEGMSLTSYFLVITEANEPGTLRAGVWYVAMTHAGLALLLAAFALLMSGGSGSFADLRANAALLSPAARNAVFVLAFLGFGSKAGLVPLHVWLPMAHPAAPSHVSALMSGVMIKLGVYGMLRVTLDLLGGGPAWWGTIVMLAGALSALIGILYALMENDLKRLLAYSSVENIGIVFIGVGAGLIFEARGMQAAAALALIAALCHALNHAAFKGLLFMGAGSVLHATHTRDLNLMGGLIKRMPWTSACFLIGAIAISGLPPLNGFVSEWLLFQSLLPGVTLPQPVVAALVTIAVGLLALTGGLVVAGFVKAFGITFLAIPRSEAAGHAHESGMPMRIGMGMLAAACVVLGLAPFAVVPRLARAIAGLDGLPAVAPAFSFNLSLQTSGGFAQMSPTLIGVGVLLLVSLVPLVLTLLGVNQRLRVSESWGCGRVGQTARMEYTATAFAEPLRRIFVELYRPTKELTIDFHPESKYFVQSIEYRSEITPWFEKYIYAPLLKAAQWVSFNVRKLQSGSLHGYVAYLFIVLVVMLGLLLLPGG
ncbi:MAG TPA: hydrogenase 4 subunit B [Blastocatellia bacterium]|nr:hydrogenase 4 subunit B [Blastocatellia bacterium]